MLDADYCRTPVINRDGDHVAYALVDLDDAPLIQQWAWYRVGDGSYAGRRTKRHDGTWAVLMMHALILGTDDGERPSPGHLATGKRVEVDHRRTNLRAAMRNHNMQNVPARGGSSQHRGVSWDAARCKWRAFYGRAYLGQYSTELEAAEIAASYRREHAPFSID